MIFSKQALWDAMMLLEMATDGGFTKDAAKHGTEQNYMTAAHSFIQKALLNVHSWDGADDFLAKIHMDWTIQDAIGSSKKQVGPEKSGD
jgi:hypothetical protein